MYLKLPLPRQFMSLNSIPKRRAVDVWDVLNLTLTLSRSQFSRLFEKIVESRRWYLFYKCQNRKNAKQKGTATQNVYPNFIITLDCFCRNLNLSNASEVQNSKIMGALLEGEHCAIWVTVPMTSVQTLIKSHPNSCLNPYLLRGYKGIGWM